ncbi:hypothetical protein GDO81_021159 [Engystomops pustulosus]|uniref:Uncharacterized protein n=1 Tax=Engystomops pustulosus TaxID=76066 RepID=A0AAV6YYY8_ENGPU|nr:hypothetical protein GDO81_021159 [Engystomops pustulosus]
MASCILLCHQSHVYVDCEGQSQDFTIYNKVYLNALRGGKVDGALSNNVSPVSLSLLPTPTISHGGMTIFSLYVCQSVCLTLSHP